MSMATFCPPAPAHRLSGRRLQVVGGWIVMLSTLAGLARTLTTSPATASGSMAPTPRYARCTQSAPASANSSGSQPSANSVTVGPMTTRVKATLGCSERQATISLSRPALLTTYRFRPGHGGVMDAEVDEK